MSKQLILFLLFAMMHYMTVAQNYRNCIRQNQQRKTRGCECTSICRQGEKAPEVYHDNNRRFIQNDDTR